MSSSNKLNWIEHGAIVLALLTAFLYASHTAYNQGYLLSFGVNTTIMEKSFHKTLYGGMLLCLNLTGKAIIIWLSIATLFLLIVFPYARFAANSIKNKRIIVKAKNKLSSKSSPTKSERFSIRFFNRALCAFIILIVLVSVMRSFEKKGEDDALHLIKQYNTKTLPDDKLVQIKTEKSFDTFFIIDCGNDLCAGIDMANGSIAYFNKNNQKVFASKKSIKQ